MFELTEIRCISMRHARHYRVEYSIYARRERRISHLTTFQDISSVIMDASLRTSTALLGICEIVLALAAPLTGSYRALRNICHPAPEEI